MGCLHLPVSPLQRGPTLPPPGPQNIPPLPPHAPLPPPFLQARGASPLQPRGGCEGGSSGADGGHSQVGGRVVDLW